MNKCGENILNSNYYSSIGLSLKNRESVTGNKPVTIEFDISNNPTSPSGGLSHLLDGNWVCQAFRQLRNYAAGRTCFIRINA